MKEIQDKPVECCINCGAPIVPNSVFCDVCGWKHGDILPEIITEEDIRRWNHLPNEKKEEKEPKSKLRIFIPIVLGTAMMLIVILVAVYAKIIKPEILNWTEAVEQEQSAEGELAEVLKENTADIPALTPTAAATPEATPTPTPTPTQTPTPTPEATPTAAPVVITHKFVDGRMVIDSSRYPRFSMQNVASMTSSSEYVQNRVKNNADLIFDDNEKTSWQEGVEGDGIGQQIYCQLNREYVIRYFAFKLGNWRSNKYYNGNGRPKTLTVTADEHTFTFDFPEGKKEYVIELSEEISATNVTVTIDSVYKGTTWDDTCITEFHIYGY